jgi:predicted lipid-binding transport protein (Tim44 family)
MILHFLYLSTIIQLNPTSTIFLLDEGKFYNNQPKKLHSYLNQQNQNPRKLHKNQTAPQQLHGSSTQNIVRYTPIRAQCNTVTSSWKLPSTQNPVPNFPTNFLTIFIGFIAQVHELYTIVTPKIMT